MTQPEVGSLWSEPGIGPALPPPPGGPHPGQQGHDSEPHPTFLLPGTTRLTWPSHPALHRPRQEEAGGKYQLPGESEPGRVPGGGGSPFFLSWNRKDPEGLGPTTIRGASQRCSAGTPAPQDFTLDPWTRCASSSSSASGRGADSGMRAASNLDTRPPAASPQRWAGQPAGPEAVGTLCLHQTRARQSPQQGSGWGGGGRAGGLC